MTDEKRGPSVKDLLKLYGQAGYKYPRLYADNGKSLVVKVHDAKKKPKVKKTKVYFIPDDPKGAA